MRFMCGLASTFPANCICMLPGSSLPPATPALSWCRDWFMGRCKKDDCRLPHLWFDLPADKPPQSSRRGLALAWCEFSMAYVHVRSHARARACVRSLVCVPECVCMLRVRALALLGCASLVAGPSCPLGPQAPQLALQRQPS